MNYDNSIANIKIVPNNSAPLIYILQLKYGETLFSSAYIVISERQDQGWAVFKKASV